MTPELHLNKTSSVHVCSLKQVLSQVVQVKIEGNIAIMTKNKQKKMWSNWKICLNLKI
jgi:hypothetical protein